MLDNKKVREEVEKDLAVATVIIGTTAALTLAEDALTGGAGTVDDIPSIMGGSAVARLILGL